MSTQANGIVRRCVTFASVCTLAASSLSVTTTAWAASPAATNAPAVADSRPDPSLAAPAEHVAATVGTHEVARVVSVREVAGKPVFDVYPVRGTRQALAVVTREQQQDETVAVDVEHRQQFLLGSNDQYRSQQWALNKVNADAAWTVSRGAGQIVAVVDSGVASVPDLAGQVLPGADFANRDCARRQGNGGCDGRADGNGHGTHVAGIIAAQANNEIGIAGLAPEASVLPVRALDAQGRGYSADIANAITWATDNGASIINLSLGGQYDASMRLAIDYARSKGKIVVAAAGNSGDDTVSYPAALANVIAVGATASDDSIAPYSSYGRHLDVSAPGSSILSTAPDGYAFMSGTSMAAPYVSATVALLRSAAVARHLGGFDPQQVLEASAIDIGARGRDDRAGSGRIDAYRALCWLGACGPRTRVAARVTTSRHSVLVVQAMPTGVHHVQVLQAIRGHWRLVAVRRTNLRGVMAVPILRKARYLVVIPQTLRSARWMSRAVRN